MLKLMLLAGAGGFFGTCCRYLTGRWCAAAFGTSFPVATLLVNIAGCFLIGLLLGLAEKTSLLTPAQNALLITGFCGGFTTFSSFAGDLCLLGNRGQWLPAVLYLSATLILGILLLLLGRNLIR